MRATQGLSNKPGGVSLAQPDGVHVAGLQPDALEVDGLARAWVAAVHVSSGHWKAEFPTRTGRAAVSAPLDGRAVGYDTIR